MSEIILVDTNLLVFLGDIGKNYNNNLTPFEKGIFHFWNTNANKIAIPDIVWTEFTGLFLHKRIDFTDYDLWYQKVYSAYEKIYLHLSKQKIRIISFNKLEDGSQLFNIANAITTMKVEKQLIDEFATHIQRKIQDIDRQLNNSGLILEKREKLQRDKKRINDSLQNGKMLDGMDSVLYAFAILIAAENPEDKVTVVTDDEFMRRTMNYMVENYHIPHITRKYFKKIKKGNLKAKSWR